MDFLITLYSIGYALCLLSLILWFYFRENEGMSNLMSKSFLGMFFVYLFALALAPGATQFKLLILFRDLVVLGFVSQFFSFFRRNKAVFIGLLVVLFGAFKFVYFDYLQNSLKNQQMTLTEEKIVTPVEETNSASDLGLAENGELLVEIKNGATIEAIQAILDKYDIIAERAFPEMERPNETDLDDYFSLNIPDNQLSSLDAIKGDLQATGFVDWVEENEMIQTKPIEGKSSVSIQKNYGIDDPGLEHMWGFDKMEVDQLYQFIKSQGVKPKQDAIIAILDTGIDAKHEDIKDNYKSFNRRYDMDQNGHGTHCAGIAAAVSNNTIGIASFSPDNQFVDVASVTVLKAFGGGTERGIIKGIIYAADQGASVISMSLGGPSRDGRQDAYNRAVKYANKAGAIVVVAAGNSNKDAKNYSPANAKGVITVSAVNQRLGKAQFSNTVNNIKMGIAAPGVDIYSTFPNNAYRNLSGTSMATPYVAGLLGVMKSIKPELTTQEAYDILKETGVKTDNTAQTGRFIQPMKAIQLLVKK